MGRNVNRFIRRGLFSVFCTSFSGVRCTLYISAETNNLCCPKTHRLFPSIHRGVKMGVIIILCRLWDWDFVCKMARSELASEQNGAYVLCYVGHLMSGLRPYFFTSGHISDLIGDIPAVKSSKLPCSMFFIAQTFTISQGEQRGVKIDLVSTTIISATILLLQNGFLAPRS